MDAMLVNDQIFYNTDPPDAWGKTVFQYCTFDGLDIEGGSYDGAFLGCTFEGFQDYWGCFLTAVLVGVNFRNCTFRGTSFRGCKFIDCTFESCQFQLDSLGGSCTIDGCSFTESRFTNCSAVQSQTKNDKVFQKNRFYACAFERCRGFDGVAKS